MAWASISLPLCAIRTLSRIEGLLIFRIVLGGTWGDSTDWSEPILLEVQRVTVTTLSDDAAGEFRQKKVHWYRRRCTCRREVQSN